MHRVSRAATVALALCLAGSVAGCVKSPSSKDDVCSTYDELGKQYMQGNGIIGNPLFHKAGDMADVASRYKGEPSLTQDAKALRAIADSDATDGLQLANATTHIAQLCGHTFATNAMFGN
jgi:hypothetical protein